MRAKTWSAKEKNEQIRRNLSSLSWFMARWKEPMARLCNAEVDSQLRDALERWGMNPTAWLARLDQLDRQCARALGVAQRVLERARGLAQQRFHGPSLVSRDLRRVSSRRLHMT